MERIVVYNAFKLCCERLTKVRKRRFFDRLKKAVEEGKETLRVGAFEGYLERLRETEYDATKDMLLYPENADWVKVCDDGYFYDANLAVATAEALSFVFQVSNFRFFWQLPHILSLKRWYNCICGMLLFLGNLWLFRHIWFANRCYYSIYEYLIILSFLAKAL